MQYNVEGTLTMGHSSAQCPPKHNDNQQLLDESSGPEAHGCCTTHDNSEEDAQGITSTPPEPLVQMVLMLIIAVPLQFDTVVPKAWLKNNDWILYMCLCGYIGLMCFLCSDAGTLFSFRFALANNFLVYASIIMQGVLIGIGRTFVDTNFFIHSMSLASVIIAIILGAWTAYARITKTDFMGPYLLGNLSEVTSFLVVLLLLSVLFGYSSLSPFDYVLGFPAAIFILCCYVYTTQVTVGGPHADDGGWATQLIEL